MNTTLTDNSLTVTDNRSPRSGQQISIQRAKSYDLNGSGSDGGSDRMINTLPDFDATSEDGTKRSKMIPEDNSSLDSKLLIDQGQLTPYCPKINKLFE